VSKGKTTLDVPAPRGGAQRPRPVLRRLHGPDGTSIEAVPLRPGRVALGRDLEGVEGLELDDPRVSRVHAVLHVASRNSKVRVADEGSRHGTWVNGTRVEEAWLDDGDVLRLGDTHLHLRIEPPTVHDSDIPEILGVAPSIRTLRHAVRQVARDDVTVMLRGASGTGKEVIARSVHRESGRTGPFVAVNCAAIPEHLAESQLFGHISGAFTGARGDHAGFFRAAHGGTLFLDEIGDMPLDLQPKLLRALEQRAVIPVGSTSPTAFDARIVVATHRNLEQAVERGTFRGDLYARLAHFHIDIPALADRSEDVLLLLRHALGPDALPLDPDLVGLLLAHPWPYNVRELFAVAGELRVRGRGQTVLGPDIIAHRLTKKVPPLPREGSTVTGAKRTPTTASGEASTPAHAGSGASAEGDWDRPSWSGSGPAVSDEETDVGNDRAAPPTREELLQLAAQHRGNVRAIARATGRSRMQVYRWLEQYGVDLANYRDS
jgi:DNA-binding NtrC family response regulator